MTEKQKQCARERAKKYYEQNRERTLERHKEHRERKGRKSVRENAAALKKKGLCEKCMWGWHYPNWNPEFKHLEGELMCHCPSGGRKGGQEMYHTVVDGTKGSCRDFERREAR